MKTEKFIFLKKKKTRRRKRIAFSLSVSASACFVSFQEVDESVIAVVKSQSEIGWEKTTKPHRNEGIDRGERERENGSRRIRPSEVRPRRRYFSPRDFSCQVPVKMTPATGHRPRAEGPVKRPQPLAGRGLRAEGDPGLRGLRGERGRRRTDEMAPLPARK